MPFMSRKAVAASVRPGWAETSSAAKTPTRWAAAQPLAGKLTLNIHGNHDL